ncbi:ATP-binding protein [Acidimicrobium ferrooxidans]|nr:ATP-binding protein [Acidimicrobium ferrooxidans]
MSNVFTYQDWKFGRKTLKHLLEVLKIIDGAMNADRAKVQAYAEQLASKLEQADDGKSAERLRTALRGGKTQQLALSRASGGRLPVDSESRLPLADVEVFDPKRPVDVFLSSSVERTVEEFLTYISAADQLIAQGVGITPSLLAFGPPGCGKTELGRHIASRLDLPLLTARTDSLISSYLGSTAKNLRSLFEHAMSRPCVLFLDEFDAVAKLRDDRHELGELKRVVVSLLQNIDALDSETVLIAATNHEHLLDKAIWRRFSCTVKVGFPETEARRSLFEKYLGSFATMKDTSLFAALSEGLSGASIRQVAEDAKRNAILRSQPQVAHGEFLRRIAQIRSPKHFEAGVELGTTLRAVRALDEKAFTYRRLSEMFDVSVGHVSNMMKRGE